MILENTMINKKKNGLFVTFSELQKDFMQDLIVTFHVISRELEKGCNPVCVK